MRKMTKEEFVQTILYDLWGLHGISEDEINTAYSCYMIGRYSVRW